MMTTYYYCYYNDTTTSTATTRTTMFTVLCRTNLQASNVLVTFYVRVHR